MRIINGGGRRENMEWLMFMFEWKKKKRVCKKKDGRKRNGKGRKKRGEIEEEGNRKGNDIIEDGKKEIMDEEIERLIR